VTKGSIPNEWLTTLAVFCLCCPSRLHRRSDCLLPRNHRQQFSNLCAGRFNGRIPCSTHFEGLYAYNTRKSYAIGLFALGDTGVYSMVAQGGQQAPGAWSNDSFNCLRGWFVALSRKTGTLTSISFDLLSFSFFSISQKFVFSPHASSTWASAIPPCIFPPMLPLSR